MFAFAKQDSPFNRLPATRLPMGATRLPTGATHLRMGATHLWMGATHLWMGEREPPGGPMNVHLTISNRLPSAPSPTDSGRPNPQPTPVGNIPSPHLPPLFLDYVHLCHRRSSRFPSITYVFQPKSTRQIPPCTTFVSHFFSTRGGWDRVGPVQGSSTLGGLPDQQIGCIMAPCPLACKWPGGSIRSPRSAWHRSGRVHKQIRSSRSGSPGERTGS
jgi:hypothetical protein